ncbi:hypothetical protein HDF14_002776 [Edaphobacter lichenicola]|uniref:Uncharacterized protein n=1 Tax=Tunturiibacter gelidiferens TaxID=3069689 RepID=A0A9X0QF80_9BACT|nr:hypothetical protein [Edaphobacter lichenicola]
MLTCIRNLAKDRVCAGTLTSCQIVDTENQFLVSDAQLTRSAFLVTNTDTTSALAGSQSASAIPIAAANDI